MFNHFHVYHWFTHAWCISLLLTWSLPSTAFLYLHETYFSLSNQKVNKRNIFINDTTQREKRRIPAQCCWEHPNETSSQTQRKNAREVWALASTSIKYIAGCESSKCASVQMKENKKRLPIPSSLNFSDLELNISHFIIYSILKHC